MTNRRNTHPLPQVHVTHSLIGYEPDTEIAPLIADAFDAAFLFSANTARPLAENAGSL